MFFRAAFHVLRVNAQRYALVRDLVKRDFRLRYLGSALGANWSFLHPLAMISIYSVVFSGVVPARQGLVGEAVPYVIYLCAGLLPWNAFVEAFQRGVNVFQDYAHFIKKLAFPKEILQTVVSGSGALTFFITQAFFLILWLFFRGTEECWVWLWVPALFFLQSLFAAGLGMVFSICNVFFKDVQHMITILLQVWFWLTPIVYQRSQLPSGWGDWLLVLNPLARFVDLYQRIFCERLSPSWGEILGLGFLSTVSYGLGAWMLCLFKEEVVDEL